MDNYSHIEPYYYGQSILSNGVIRSYIAKNAGTETVTTLKLGDVVVVDEGGASDKVITVSKATAENAKKCRVLGTVNYVPDVGHLVGILTRGSIVTHVESSVFAGATTVGKPLLVPDATCCCCGVLELEIKVPKYANPDGTLEKAYVVSYK